MTVQLRRTKEQPQKAKQVPMEVETHDGQMQSSASTAVTETVTATKAKVQHKPPSASAVSKAVAAWRGEVNANVQSLQERYLAVKSIPVGGPSDDDRQLSLVLIHDSGEESSEGASANVRVLFVYWLPMKRLVGKPVTLDEEGFVQHVPNFIKSEEDFSGAEIIHPAIGARMRKAKHDWEQVPNSICRLKDMFETAWTPVTGFEEWATSECIVCKKNEVETDAQVQEFSPITKCAFCLLCFHTECMETLVKELPTLESKRKKLLNSGVDKLNIETIPRSLVCATTPEAKLVLDVMKLQTYQSCGITTQTKKTFEDP